MAEAGRWQHVSWPVTHAAFAEHADPVLAQAPALVAHLGIDEHRRGLARWRIDEETGEYLLLADRWHTCFFDLSGVRACWGRWRAAPLMTPRTGSPRPPGLARRR